MTFTGDLDYLPIVDVIQLVHATRKSGVLRVKSRKRESSLVFKDGYIVSASHVNNSVRIGTILIERNIITPEILDQALLEQKAAGAKRKPLINTLLDKGTVKEEDAYRGLEHLIERTIVEILTWKRGTFTMEEAPAAGADDYRYYPGKISREINVDAQGVLMDALRVFDEKVRDGVLAEEAIPEDDDTMTGCVPDWGSPAPPVDGPGLLRPEPRRDREGKHQYCAACRAVLVQEEDREPAEPAVKVPMEYVGRGFVVVGLVMLAYGVKGLCDYGQMQPTVAELPGVGDPPGPFRFYLAHGLLPTLQALVGGFAALAGHLCVKMRQGAGKWLERAAWSGIPLAVANELANLVVSIGRASSSPSFSYYLVEFIGFILMTAFWTVPLLAVVWFLRRDVITHSFFPAPVAIDPEAWRFPSRNLLDK